MFAWMKERKVRKLVEGAEAYLSVYCRASLQQKTSNPVREEPSRRDSNDPKSSDSHKPTPNADNGVRYSRVLGLPVEVAPQDDSDKKASDESEGSDSQSKFSLRDNYDSRSIQSAMRSLSNAGSPTRTLQTLEKLTDISFVDKMLEHINKKQLRDSVVYKAAQIDRRLYSKIVSDRTYKPAKDTCIALCLAMKLTLPEANDLLSRAGYTLSHSSKRDVIL